MATGNTNVVADTGDFLVVYPQALDGFIGALNTVAPIWQDGTLGGNLEADDLSFFDVMLDQVAMDYQVDESRVYTMGVGSGGAASAFLTCQMPERFAAMANVQGYIDCAPSLPRPGLFMHGTGDPLIPEGGIPGILPPFITGVNSWVQANACSTMPDSTIFPDLVTTDSSTVTLYEYPDCSNGSEVLYYRIEGGGRVTPGASNVPDAGPTNRDINGDVEIWNFFNRQRLVTSTRVVPSPTFDVRVFPNPVSDQLNLEFTLPAEAPVSLQLVSPLGQTVANLFEGRLPGGEQRIMLQTEQYRIPRGLYFYQLRIGDQMTSGQIVWQ